MLEKQIFQLIVTSTFIIVIATFLFFIKINNSKKHVMLYLGIILIISYLIPSFKLSLLRFNEFIFLILAFYLFLEQKKNEIIFPKKLFLILIILTFISSLINKEIQYWFQFFVIPYSIFYILSKLEFGFDSKHLGLKIILIMLNLIFIIYILSFFYGKVENVPAFGMIQTQENLSLLGYGARHVSLSLFSVDLGHNMIASLFSILSILCTVLYFYSSKTFFERIFYVLEIILGFVVIIITSSRGNFIATGLAVLFIYTISIRKNKIFITGLLTLALFLIYLNSEFLLSLVSEQEFKRWLEILSLTSKIDTFNYRLDFLNYTLANSLINFLGLGFDYYYSKQIDDAMLVSFLINGVGIVSTGVFFILILKIFYQFIFSFLKRKNIYNILGISLLISVVTSGFSQTYLVGWAIYSILIWLLIAISFFNMNKGIQDNNNEAKYI
ncbi:MAG: oligosaccharide repeat unit polymerase [Ignavibacteriales bacterium]|nr:oligosaccharide repeat unit polymerase [Ignavibacteriales bacterium]